MGSEGQRPLGDSLARSRAAPGAAALLSLPLSQALQDYVGLERFWQRFNKARLEEQALERERAAVSLQNQRLRGLLQQYLEGLSVSPEVLSKPNPLLAIEHKSRVPRFPPRPRPQL